MHFADSLHQRAGSSPTPTDTSSPTSAHTLPPAPSPRRGGLGRGDQQSNRLSTPSHISHDDLAFPPATLALPREPIAQRRQHLHALRDALLAVSDDRISDETVAHLQTAIESYLHWAVEEFEAPHDHFRLVGEDNYRRYLPVGDLRIRIHADDAPFDILARVAAARAAGCRAVVSWLPDSPPAQRALIELIDNLTDPWAGAIEFVEESDDHLAVAMRTGQTRRVRYAAPDRPSESIRRASAESYVYLADAPPLAHGRVELLWYFQEQSLSHVYHRYGNLGRRAGEHRAPVS
jgi:RHH-type proline utilization regulon transcriptional repressor/proline dehydrogenase/delta 1-pyrroline-5-carboxylate dehydrogenase